MHGQEYHEVKGYPLLTIEEPQQQQIFLLISCCRMADQQNSTH